MFRAAVCHPPSTMDEDYSAGSVDADREMTRLWRTWRTVFEMLLDRVRIFSSFKRSDASHNHPAIIPLTKFNKFAGLRGHGR